MKKILSVFLCLLLLAQLCCGLGLTASAEADVQRAASVRADDLSVEQRILLGYTVTQIPAGAVAVDSAEEFLAMSANGVYYLDADITLTSAYSGEFKGKLYGNEHTVTLSKGSGFFATAKPVFEALNGAEIYDLTITGELSMYAEYVGALAQTASDSIIRGVTNEADVSNTRSEKFGGGIVGYAADTTLQYCVNKGDITGSSTETRLGGLVGQMNEAEATLTLENCINYGSVTGVNQTGGLVSRVESGKEITFKNCANFGVVTVGSTDGGGMVGKVKGPNVRIVLEGCYNSARIVGGTNTGGMIGYTEKLSGLTVTDCHNGCFVEDCNCKGTEHGKLTNQTGNHTLGGLLGFVDSKDVSATFTDCSNSGTLIAGGSGGTSNNGSRTGGIAAVMEVKHITVKNCTNSGDIESRYYAGGLFARIGGAGESYQDADENTLYYGGTVLLENCSNSGDITSVTYGGGIVGFQQYASSLTFKNCSNSGELNCTGNAGGILARIGGDHTVGCTVELSDCTNSGKITGSGTSGGILGYFANVYTIIKSVTLTECSNTADVTSPNKVGGIVGDINAKKFTATNCRNEGDINVANQNETACAGGIAGRVWGSSSFNYCINSGDIVEKKTGDTTSILFAGGIAGWAGREGADYKDDVAYFNECVSACVVVSRNALRDKQPITAGGIVGICRSSCYAFRCMAVGAVNSTCQTAGISGSNGLNEVSGSEFTSCVVAADLYNSGAKLTGRTHGTAGVACYVWGAAHVNDCVVMGDLTLDIDTSNLTPDQVRPLSALVGYSNNGGGSYRNNFFGGKLISGGGTDCVVVMVAFTVEADVTGDVGYDISDNYSYYEYPLFYWGYVKNNVQFGCVYSEYTTPSLTEEQIADGISFADLVVENNPNMEIVRTCSGIEVPMLNFMVDDYEWALEQTGGHGYVDGCFLTCGVCGKERVELHHTYRNDCDTDCNACGEERTVGEHDFGPWITIKSATETETGLRKSTCQTCGYEETVETPVLTNKNEGEDSTNDQNSGTDVEPSGSFFEDNLVIIIAAGGGAALLVVIIVVVVIAKKSSKKKKNNSENVEN